MTVQALQHLPPLPTSTDFNHDGKTDLALFQLLGHAIQHGNLKIIMLTWGSLAQPGGGALTDSG